MNSKDIWILYIKELRSALRERAIVVNSILLPIFLYPVLLWVLFSVMTFVQGLNESFTSRIALLAGPPAAHAMLLDSLEAREDVQLFRDLDRDEGIRQVQIGEMDAVLSFLPPENPGPGIAENFQVEILHDASEARSRGASDRIEEEVTRYRTRWLEQEAASLGISETDRVLFAVSGDNVSSEEDLGSQILGMLIPLFLTIMVALGCFYPAVDTTAGERERSTWETSMTTAPSRVSLVTAKYLYVATMGVSAGILNVIAIFVSIGAIMAPLLSEEPGAVVFRLPFLAIPVMVLGAAALALLLSAAMMILASFARTFKDGQAMVQPVYFVAIFVPLLMGQQSDQTLSAGVAAIPIVNVAAMIRDSINGVFLWPYIAEAVAVNVIAVGICVWAAAFILRFEDFMIGSFDASFWRFLKDRIGKSSPGKEQA